MSLAIIMIAVLLFFLFIFSTLIILGFKKGQPDTPTQNIPIVKTPTPTTPTTPTSAPETPVTKIATETFSLDTWILQFLERIPWKVKLAVSAIIIIFVVLQYGLKFGFK